MTRRGFWCGALATATAAASTEQALAQLWNQFANASREWCRQRIALVPGESPLASQRYWKDVVKPAFHEVDLAVRNE